MANVCPDCLSRHLALCGGDIERLLFDSPVCCPHIEYFDAINEAEAADALHHCRDPRACITPGPHWRGQCHIPNEEKKG